MKRALDDVLAIVMYLSMILVLLFLLLPMIVVVVMSFDARSFMGAFPPEEFSLHWYSGLLVDEYYKGAAKTSLQIAFLASGISTVAGVLAAVAVHSSTARWAVVMEAILLSPLIVPAVIIGFALLLFSSMLGIVDGFVRLLAGHIVITLPYIVRTSLASLGGLRRSTTEAALSLGANERKVFFQITLPLIRTGVIAGAIFAFAFSMDDVAVSLFLTSPQDVTLPVAMTSMMRSAFDLKIAAVAVILSLVTGAMLFILDWTVGIQRAVGIGFGK